MTRRAHTLVPRLATLVACAAVVALVCGPVDGGATARARTGDRPRFGSGEMHLDLRLEPHYTDDGGDQFFSLPSSFDLVLTLRPDGTGVIGAESRTWPGQASLAPVRWHEAGERVVLDTLSLGAGGPALFVSMMTLALSDEDGDGVADRGEGTAAGSVQEWRGDIGAALSFEEATIAASPDTTGPVVALAWWETALPLPGRLRIVLSEPIPAAALLSAAVTADGEPVEGTIEPLGPVAGLAVAAVFTPTAFLRLDAEVALDAGGLADPAGNPATAAAPLHTVEDPGPAAANLGFERDLEGWLAGDRTAVHQGAFAGIPPAEGSRQAVVLGGGWLLGRIEVPEGAVTLELSIAGFSSGGPHDADRSGVVELHVPGGPAVVFGASVGDRTPVEQCEGCPAGWRYAAHRVSADLTPFRGRTVFLSARGGPCMNECAVVLDDIRIR